jgi:hypothetical protein
MNLQLSFGRIAPVLGQALGAFREVVRLIQEYSSNFDIESANFIGSRGSFFVEHHSQVFKVNGIKILARPLLAKQALEPLTAATR